MKKLFVKLLAVCVSISCLMKSNLSVHAVDELKQEKFFDYDSFYTQVIESDEWEKTCNRAIRGEMLQLPDELLSSLDTETLVEAVLDYPFFRDIYAFDDVQYGVDQLFESFNGAQELSHRIDAATCLLDKYINTEVLSSSDMKKMNSIEIGDSVYALSNIEVMLAQEFVVSNLDTADIAELDNIVVRKNMEKKQNSEYGTTTDIFYKISKPKYDEFSQENTLRSYPTYYVYTPNNTAVAVISRGEELSESQINSNHNYVSTYYPSAIRYGSSTTKYNCHSYAWYLQSTSNCYWMNYPNAYWNDGSYSNYSTPTVNSKMVWRTDNNVTHSAVVVDLLSGPVYPPYGYTDLVNVKSKWGELGLYKHNGLASPYWANNTYTTFYR